VTFAPLCFPIPILTLFTPQRGQEREQMADFVQQVKPEKNQAIFFMKWLINYSFQ
jgi:hypothetical protein